MNLPAAIHDKAHWGNRGALATCRVLDRMAGGWRCDLDMREHPTVSFRRAVLEMNKFRTAHARARWSEFRLTMSLFAFVNCEDIYEEHICFIGSIFGMRNALFTFNHTHPFPVKQLSDLPGRFCFCLPLFKCSYVKQYGYVRSQRDMTEFVPYLRDIWANL